MRQHKRLRKTIKVQNGTVFPHPPYCTVLPPIPLSPPPQLVLVTPLYLHGTIHLANRRPGSCSEQAKTRSRTLGRRGTGSSFGVRLRQPRALSTTHGVADKIHVAFQKRALARSRPALTRTPPYPPSPSQDHQRAAPVRIPDELTTTTLSPRGPEPISASLFFFSSFFTITDLIRDSDNDARPSGDRSPAELFFCECLMSQETHTRRER